MNFSKLFRMQKDLDKYIEDKQGLVEESLLERKLMAFQVELAELANETRCFKFWSEKGPSEETIILEEYVDGIHFLLSIGIEYGFDELINIDYPEAIKVSKEDLVEGFFATMKDILYLREENTLAAYEQLFRGYIQLGAGLGFSASDINQAYVRKNEVNHERQDQGY
ncbi:dUTPase [Salipaludibacillus keqinensis]|uniref:dUTPase n=1 Tax=Salipaludibacillus keqinensis TaxID=2045207 RepID=A0A323TFZ0_9BACI|nr:dUTP diphosphatase [Salipaludibacillus keqinensis]PYZ93709.1 dUTPase [Salipaludibacillus keqinensis]